jgi:hypothetical protein
MSELYPVPEEPASTAAEVKPKRNRKDYNRKYYEKTREIQLQKSKERYQKNGEEKNKKKKEKYHNNLEESRKYFREYTRKRRAAQKAAAEKETQNENNE